MSPRAADHRHQAVGRQIDASGALQRERKREHADDEDKALPMDRAVGAVEVDAPQRTHQQRSDHRRLNIRHDTADH